MEAKESLSIPKPHVLTSRERGTSRSSSLFPKAIDTATSNAWKSACESYRKFLSDKDLKRIMLPTEPNDIIDVIEEWQRKQSASRPSRVTASLRAGLKRLQRFSASIDLIAQGTPSPGSLVWGSVKFVLIIVQDATEVYDKLCNVLVSMVDCLPRVELYTKTFLDSDMVKGCVSAFYVSILRFWNKAVKFYKRRRLWNFGRIIWNDFDAEFGELETEMIRYQERIEDAALAEHVGQSKHARVEQQAVNLELLGARSSIRENQIVAWMAPSSYDVDYYTTDLVVARALRHPKTCQWVLEKRELLDLELTGHDPILWIFARPGAGKTVLSSRLVDYYLPERRYDRLLYFFCKNTDNDKNTSTAVLRSLLYQLYRSTMDEETWTSLNDGIGEALDKSGQHKAINFTTIWQLFSTYVKRLCSTFVILDALDECQDPEQLIQGLKLLARQKHISLIVTSRREPNLVTQLGDSASIEIDPEDINADIGAYVEAKVSASRRLSNPLVRGPVVTRLLGAHDGMFLWVYLMIKELKSCISLAQVRTTLAKLPKGLDGIYQSILQRLHDTLAAPTLDLCLKVLMWVVLAVRPLKIHELKHALALHYAVLGDVLLSDEAQGLPYSDKDIELICGSLVTVRSGSLQVIHLTVKEFLSHRDRRDRPSNQSLCIGPAQASLQLTQVCFRCLQEHCVEPIVDLGSNTHRMDISIDTEVLNQRKFQAPLIDYASSNWIAHMTDCKGTGTSTVVQAFQQTFISHTTFTWIEALLAWQPAGVLPLLVALDDLQDWIDEHRAGRSQINWQYLYNWVLVIRHLLEEYGGLLSRRPWEIYVLHLAEIFTSLADLYDAFGDSPSRQNTIYLEGHTNPQPSPVRARNSQSQLRLDHRNESSSIGLFIHDERRKVYFWGYSIDQTKHLSIFVQDANTGRRLLPVHGVGSSLGCEVDLVCYAMSEDGRHIASNYCAFDESSQFICIWQIAETLSFDRRLHREPWGRLVYSQHLPLEGLSSRSVLFKDNGHCMTPGGEINLVSFDRQPLHDKFQEPILHQERIFFAASGDLLISSGLHGYARKISADGRNPTVDLSWKDQERYVADISPSGRYLILSTKDYLLGEYSLGLHDTLSNNTIHLPYHKRILCWPAKFLFTIQETRLIAFLPYRNEGIYDISIFVWDNLATQPTLKTHSKFLVDSDLGSSKIYVRHDETSALVVNRAGSIQRIGLEEVIEFPDAVTVKEAYPCSFSKVSWDGSHWAAFDCGQEKARLQILDLTLGPTAKVTRVLDLSWPPCIHPERLYMEISEDLSLLVVGKQIFDLSIRDDSLASIPFEVASHSILFQDTLNWQESDNISCAISPCRRYVAYVGRGGCHTRLSHVAGILLFRIDITERSSSQLHFKIPEALVYSSAAFHPSLPIMVMGYAEASEVGADNIEEQPPPLQVALLELDGLHLRHIKLIDSLGNPWIKQEWAWRSRLPAVHLSDCGTFAYLSSVDDLKKFPYPLITHIEGASEHPRQIKLRLAIHDAIISLERKHATSIALHLNMVEDQSLNDGSTLGVTLNDIAAVPSSFAQSNMFLLLGSNDYELMRLLIAPNQYHRGLVPQIQTLSLTFADARSRLENLWDDTYGTKMERSGSKITVIGKDTQTLESIPDDLS